MGFRAHELRWSNQINVTGVVSPEGNQELFIFNKGAAARSEGKRWQT